MAKIRDNVKKEIIHWHKREDIMDLTESAIKRVKSKGGWFGKRQDEAWLQVKQNFIQQNYIGDAKWGSYARFTTLNEMDNWAEESNLPVRLIVFSFCTLCRDFGTLPHSEFHNGKPSKKIVVEHASMLFEIEKNDFV